MSWTTRAAPAKWVLPEEPELALVGELAEITKLPLPAIRILCNRGFTDAEVVQRFLDPKLSDLRDPFDMTGMKAAIERITTAFFNNEKMVIYGDYDVDGITATSLLYMVLNKLGGQVSYYLPNRLVEGYGLSVSGIDKAKEKGVSLIITVDTGVTAVSEIDYAHSQGIDVIVTDHHEQGERLPDAEAIVNPKQDGCDYPDELSGVGVAFKVAQALYCSLNQDERELEEHLDLVALGTAADIVPLIGENRVFTRYGIRQIARTTKPGLKSLTFVAGLMGKDISTGQVVFILAPRINALGRLGDAGEAIRLLSTRDERVASEIARKLDSENRRRKEIDTQTLKEALAQMEDIVDLKTDRAIVLAGEGWHQGVIGIVASRLVVKYGGHKYAAGLSIKSEDIPAFRERFKQVSRQDLTVEDIAAKLNIDLELELSEIDDAFMDAIESFAPFGPQNMRPVFMTRNCEIVGQPYTVGKNHLKMRVRKGDSVFDVIGFGFGDWTRMISAEGCLIDLVYVVEYNTYNDITRKQIRLKDLRLTASCMPTA